MSTTYKYKQRDDAERRHDCEAFRDSARADIDAAMYSLELAIRQAPLSLTKRQLEAQWKALEDVRGSLALIVP